MEGLSLLTDFYELTMMQAYYLTERKSGERQSAAFDMFYRENPDGNGYAIAAGLWQAVEYINGLRFGREDVDYLKSTGAFEDGFLDSLLTFKFTGDVNAIPEGTVVFPNEPLLTVVAPVMEAQLIETALLNIINHQSLIATKAARIAQAASDDVVIEMGLRRAQGPDAGIYGARAAIIGGCAATSNVLAGRMFGVPVRGTHAHSWIMSFDSEIEAFRMYAKIYPDSCMLLADTYDTLKSGVPNAIAVFGEMRGQGFELKNYGIRLDSGDLAYLSKKARRMLDGAGFAEAKISASGDLDEHLITDLKNQGARIDIWGVGTNLITSKNNPAFGGVYKMAAVSNGGKWEPRIKLSENPAKVTNPGRKKIHRIYDGATGKIKADLIALSDESYDNGSDLTIFDPFATWKRMTLEAGSFTLRELLEPVFIGGACVQKKRDVMEIREYSVAERHTLWDEHKRLTNPHPIPVDLSKPLYDLKQRMIASIRA
ncbi:MAG: nicotinate phosphoribosyltransferase [Defluviitaleaceae bacterium]|nr:nicotinate phosphoribosyltransferase [Defluviitaleaceae bacterium]